MELDIIPQTTWNVKRGKYLIRLVDVKTLYPHQYAKRQTIMTRLVWEVVYPSEPGIIQMLGKSYPNDFFRDHPLYKDMCDWKGTECIHSLMQGKKFDPSWFYNHVADAVVDHKRNENHKNPYCQIKKLYPAGTLVHPPVKPIIQICDSPALPALPLPPCTPIIENSNILDINIDRKEGGLSNAA